MKLFQWDTSRSGELRVGAGFRVHVVEAKSHDRAKRSVEALKR